MTCDFMNHAQALSHGDLHSGSIFINATQTKVFDPEFAFYGPMGYDLGNVIAHLLLAGYHAEFGLEEGGKRSDFLSWINASVQDTVELFKTKFIEKFQAVAKDELAATEGFREHYLNGVLADAAGTAGMELIRRVVGVAKVKDITSISDKSIRAAMEKKILAAGKMLVLDRHRITEGSRYLEIAAFQ